MLSFRIPLSKMTKLMINIVFKLFAMNFLSLLGLAFLIGRDHLHLFVLCVESQLPSFDTFVYFFEESHRKLAVLMVHVFGEVAELR